MAFTIPADQQEWAEKLQKWAAEPLHEDLEPWVEDGAFGKSLRHPLVFDIPLMLPGRANEQYAYKQQAIKDALAAQKWHSVVFLHERPYRAEALAQLEWYKIPNKTWWGLVGSVWTDSENVWQNNEEWRQVWADDRPQRPQAMSKEERAFLRALPEKFTVWRGAAEGVNEDGMSWSLDRDRALWFAKRFEREGDPLLICGIVKKSDVLAYFNGRNESEVVIFPENVSRVDSVVVGEGPEGL